MKGLRSGGEVVSPSEGEGSGCEEKGAAREGACSEHGGDSLGAK